MKKRIIALVMSMVFVVTGMSVTVYAQEESNDIIPAETQINIENGPFAVAPPISEKLFIPGNSRSFSYTLSSQTQTSPFNIVRTNLYTGIRIKYQATSASHDLTVKLYARTGQLLFTEDIRVLKSSQSSIYIDYTYLVHDLGYIYYLELSSGSGSGTMTISD